MDSYNFKCKYTALINFTKLITLHYASYTTLHYTTLHHTTLHCTALHWLQYTTLITLQLQVQLQLQL